MGRLRELNEAVNKVASESEAAKLIATWLPEQAAHLDGKSTGTQAGTRNCSLIAQFIVAFYSRKSGAQYKAGVTRPQGAQKCETFSLKKYASKNPGVLVVMAGGHDFAIVCEGNEYGLYQAWEGQFHVFPKLNDDSESHNIFGMGDDTIKLINDEVALIARKVEMFDGQEDNDGQAGTPGFFNVQAF